MISDYNIIMISALLFIATETNILTYMKDKKSNTLHTDSRCVLISNISNKV